MILKSLNSIQGIARQVAAAVLESLGTQAPSVTLFPALAMMGRKGAAASSEEMQQVLRPLKVEHGDLMEEAQLLVQHLRDVACLWSEQWMHILRDVQVMPSLPARGSMYMQTAECGQSDNWCILHRHHALHSVSGVTQVPCSYRLVCEIHLSEDRIRASLHLCFSAR